MNKPDIKKVIADMDKLIQLTEGALNLPNMPTVWTAAAGALLEGARASLNILKQGESYGQNFIFTSTGGVEHQLFTVELKPVPLFPKKNLTTIPEVIFQGIDGGFLPTASSVGVAAVQVIENWTVVSFLDNSADRRAGSHSTFVMSGAYPAESGIARAAELFPGLWSRYAFTVVMQV